jgi:hypothetical protein
MSFGLCPHTNQPFAEKFHVGVFEDMPSVSGAVQYERAREIEAAHVPGTDEWADGSNRYLFVMINEHNNVGGFHDHPGAVKAYVFESEHYPANFRWFVVDPNEAEEVKFIADEIQGFWNIVEEDAERTEHSWWLHPIVTHELDNEKK